MRWKVDSDRYSISYHDTFVNDDLIFIKGAWEEDVCLGPDGYCRAHISRTTRAENSCHKIYCDDLDIYNDYYFYKMADNMKLEI